MKVTNIWMSRDTVMTEARVIEYVECALKNNPRRERRNVGYADVGLSVGFCDNTANLYDRSLEIIASAQVEH